LKQRKRRNSQELQLGKYEFHPYQFNGMKNLQMESDPTVFVHETMNRLLTIGFTLVGSWTIVEERFDFELRGESNADNVLYAFVADGQLMYIGKTTKGLRSRMVNYRNAHSSQVTNTRNQKQILDCLAQNRSVEIYVLPDHGLLKYGGFRVNLAAGLEDSLIDEMSPPWNRGLKETEEETLVPVTK
jgi:hypothetical protein